MGVSIACKQDDTGSISIKAMDDPSTLNDLFRPGDEAIGFLWPDSGHRKQPRGLVKRNHVVVLHQNWREGVHGVVAQGNENAAFP